MALGFVPALSAQAPPERAGFEWRGYTRSPDLSELSGLAVSRRDPDTLWGLNDSGNAAQLIAIDTRARPGSSELKLRAVVNVEGVLNNDWEDLAGYVENGEPRLLIADTGDNFNFRTEAQLIFVPEPKPGERSVKPLRVLRFEYEGGPRDCESVAIDLPGRRILLADKGHHPSGLYELKLDGPDSGQKARRIGDFPELSSRPVPRAATLSRSRWGQSPTGMDLSADGLRLLVITGDSLSLFVRRPQESWKDVLLRPYARQPLPELRGFESAALDAAGQNAWVGAEGSTAHIYRWLQMPVP